MDPRPFPPPAAPYEPRRPSEVEHDWYLWLAIEIANRTAVSLAKGDMRLGTAHRYLMAAHFAAIVDGAGDEAAAAFINDLLRDYGVVDGQ